jgi:hypothetical protein
MGCQRERQGPAGGLNLEGGGEEKTYVADSNGEKEKENPEVEIKSLSRGSTFIRHPERKESEQPGCVEGNCQISLCVE